VDELAQYIDIAKANGAAQVNFLSFVPRGMGADMRQLQIPHLDVYQQLSSIYEHDDDATRKLLAGSLPDIKRREARGQCKTSNECVAAYRGLLYVTPSGSTYSCPNLACSEFSIGNVCQDSLRTISDNLSALHNKVNILAGACQCVGEKILYEKSNDLSSLTMLGNLQEKLFNNQHSFVSDTLLTSYCVNRNW
jgi:MoaA/NifB/PqqE/SkfB family radical SAM enzyme